MSQPLVSVIMPARDVEQFIAEAISSVMRQSYTHWELIVIENASKDNTASVVKSFSDERIKLIHTDTAGLSNARNIGLETARGDFICFLDADDQLTVQSIASRVLLLNEKPEVMFADGGMLQYDERMQKVRHDWRPGFKGNPYREMMLLSPKCFCGITWMIRRMENMKLHFDTSWTHLEDRLFFLSIAKQGNYDFVNEVTYEIRRRRGSLMTELGSLEKAYARYRAHVNSLNELSPSIQLREQYLFHRMFFRTYLKHFRLVSVLRHGWYLASHKG